MTTQTYVGTLIIEECCECHVPFGMTQAMNDLMRRTGKLFYCPNGHPQLYTESTEQKLRKEVEDAKAQAKRFEVKMMVEQSERKHTEHKLRATKGVITRTKNRIARGVCPCCNRQLVNIAQHMSKQHPDYAGPESE